MQESDFVHGIRNMDQEMFRELVSRYQESLIRLCKGFLHNEEDARDVTQEIFIEVIESISHFRENAKLSTWLYRIAVNKALNHLRKNKLKHLSISLDMLHSNVRSMPYKSNSYESIDPADNMEKSDRKKQIRLAIDGLPKNQRIAFVLNKYLDLSYREIADIMDISVSAVESLIHRAKINLQKKLLRLYRKNLL